MFSAIALLSSGAFAQFQGPVEGVATPGQTYLVVGSNTCQIGGGIATTTFCVNSAGINLNYFATAASVAGIPANNALLFGQVDALQRDATRAYQGIAISSAMKDAIPNPGDRFAVRLNAATFRGQPAGAIGVSYNVTDVARISLNYGQSRSQAIVSGGLNLSFH
jgi:hypothetical protein